MNIACGKIWQRHLIISAVCVLTSSCLWAQAAGSGSSNDAQAAVPLPAATASTELISAAKPHDDSYLIGANDVLAINVWKEPEISRSIPVRSDGKVTLPLAGEVQAGGLTPKQLEQEIAKKLQSFISEPDVTVIVQEMRSRRFNILGQVVRPGTFSITSPLTVLDAIALAGGFRDFAKQKSIYVLRQNADGTQMRLPFNYKDVIKGKNVDQNVRLQPGDTVVIP